MWAWEPTPLPRGRPGALGALRGLSRAAGAVPLAPGRHRPGADAANSLPAPLREIVLALLLATLLATLLGPSLTHRRPSPDQHKHPHTPDSLSPLDRRLAPAAHTQIAALGGLRRPLHAVTTARSCRGDLTVYRPRHRRTPPTGHRARAVARTAPRWAPTAVRLLLALARLLLHLDGETL